MGQTRDFLPTDQISTPEDLVSLLTEPLPENGVIVASAGEWRLAPDGLWHFWQDPEWADD